MQHLREPSQYPLSTEHVCGGPHQEADMEGRLPHRPPILHVPHMFSVQLRVGLLRLTIDHLGQ